MNIGYVGPFGDSNFGDYAMLVNDVLDIGVKDITVFTHNDKLFSVISSMYLKDYNISLCKIITESKEIKTSNKYSVEYNNYPDIPLEILNEAYNLEDVIKYIKKIDKLVVIGGGYFNHVWNAKHRRSKLASILVPIILANQQGKKIIFMGNTYGPFNESEDFFSNFFNYLQTEVIASRDNLYSISNLKKIGYNKDVYLLPDDLYFLNKKIAIKEQSDENYIILELYCSIDEINYIKNELIKFVDTIYEKYNYTILFVPFDKGYGGEYQAEEIRKFTDKIKIFEIKNKEFQKIEDILSVVKNAKFVLCQRYHLFLFALANNIPAKQILKKVCGDYRYYYSKSNGLLRQVFKNQIYQEDLFFELNISDAFINIENNLLNIINKQHQLFNEDKIYCEKEMKEARDKYIKNYIMKDDDL